MASDASWSIYATGSNSITVRIIPDTSQDLYYRVFCRLSSDTSSSVYDNTTLISANLASKNITINGLSPGTSYTLNVGYTSSSTSTNVTWLGAKTTTTPSGSTTTTYYYRCYDETNSTYLT